MKKLLLVIALLPALAQAGGYTEESLREILTTEREKCPDSKQPVALDSKDALGDLNKAMACWERNRLRDQAGFILSNPYSAGGNLFPFGFGHDRLKSFLAGGSFECDYPCKGISQVGDESDYSGYVPTPTVRIRTETWGGGTGTTSTVTIDGQTVGSHTIIHK